jgi:hypothetical protein
MTDESIPKSNDVAAKKESSTASFRLLTRITVLTNVFALVAAVLIFGLAKLDIPLRTPDEQQVRTPEEQKACTPDVQRLCRTVIDQGDFTILACLQQNRAKISEACNRVLKSHGQ